MAEIYCIFYRKEVVVKTKRSDYRPIKRKIAENLASASNESWHNGIKNSYEDLKVSNELKKGFDYIIESVKQELRAKDKNNYHDNMPGCNVVADLNVPNISGINVNNIKHQVGLDNKTNARNAANRQQVQAR